MYDTGHDLRYVGGNKKDLWMMYGELLGVAIVAISAVAGVASLMVNYPGLFGALKLIGAAYLCYIGLNMFQSKGSLVIETRHKTLT